MPRTPPARSVTLHDVAKAAGVSPITASRALGNPQLVSEATIQRVRDAVQATGYIPNLLAGGLKSRRSMTVGALVPVISVPQFLPTVQALTEDLARAGYQLVLGQSGYDHAREQALVNTMVSRRVDAVVVAGLLGPGTDAEPLLRAGIPLIETWDLTDRPADMVVGFSHLKVGGAVAGYFLAKGWKRLGVASADDQRARQRVEGLVSAVGRPVPTVFVPAPSTLESGRRALAQLLEQDPKVRAISCSSDALADGVMTEARARGLRVPEDLAVCGFGDANFAAHLVPSLTTVRVDGARIGQLASQMIVERCRGETVRPRVVDVGFEIVERDSTGGAVKTSGR